jgi:hypothetical protein
LFEPPEIANNIMASNILPGLRMKIEAFSIKNSRQAAHHVTQLNPRAMTRDLELRIELKAVDLLLEPDLCVWIGQVNLPGEGVPKVSLTVKQRALSSQPGKKVTQLS